MHNQSKLKKEKRERRHTRIRAKISGTEDRPRLSVFKSNLFLYAQLIDDVNEKTLLALSTKGIKGKNDLERAHTLGKELASKAKTKKIEKVIFDRGGFIYIGKIKALAEGAREGGLVF